MGFLCFCYLGAVCLCCVFCVFCYFLLFVVSTSASDSLERLVSEMTYYVLSTCRTLLTHSLTTCVCTVCSFAASDKATGWNISSNLQAAAGSCPADAAVIRQVEWSECSRRCTHPAYHHFNASHCVCIIDCLRSWCAYNSDCWSSQCYVVNSRCHSSTSYIHKNSVIDYHYNSHT